MGLAVEPETPKSTNKRGRKSLASEETKEIEPMVMINLDDSDAGSLFEEPKAKKQKKEKEKKEKKAKKVESEDEENDDDQTWEPVDNLAGSEDLIKEFESSQENEDEDVKLCEEGMPEDLYFW